MPIHSSSSTKAIVISPLGQWCKKHVIQTRDKMQKRKSQLCSASELPSSQNSHTVNQIIFLNYDPYEYESKYTSFAVIHVNHTNQVTHKIMSYLLIGHFTITVYTPTMAPHIRMEVFTILIAPLICNLLLHFRQNLL